MFLTLLAKFMLCFNNWELDRGSKRSSPRYGLSTPYSLTIRNSARLFHHILFNMGDLHVVLPALKLSNMNAGILIKMQQVRLMMFSLDTVDYSMSFLLLSTQNFFCWTSGGDHSEPFLLFIVRPLLHAHEILVSAQGPFWVFGFGA